MLCEYAMLWHKSSAGKPASLEYCPMASGQNSTIASTHVSLINQVFRLKAKIYQSVVRAC